MEITFSNAIEIENRIENVYAYVSKLENFSIWNYAVMSVEPVENNNEESKDRYILKRDLGNVVETERVTIIQTKKNQMLHFRATGGRFSYEMKYALRPFGEQTILKNVVSMKPEGIRGFMLKLLKSNIQTEVNKNLYVLKQLLENG